MSWNIEVESGSSVRLPTKGKYCDRDIVVTANGGESSDCGGDLLRDIAERTISGEVKVDSAKKVGSYAFHNCSALTSVDFPAVTVAGEYAFYNCSALASVNFPLLTSTGEYAFYGCALTSVFFPALTGISANAFRNCSTLRSADFPTLTSVGGNAFYSCTTLTSLILRNTNIASLSSSQALNNTPINSGTGYIYVPSALIDQYKAATNWSTYYAKFRALEDYTVDGTTTGELDLTKI